MGLWVQVAQVDPTLDLAAVFFLHRLVPMDIVEDRVFIDLPLEFALLYKLMVDFVHRNMLGILELSDILLGDDVYLNFLHGDSFRQSEFFLFLD